VPKEVKPNQGTELADHSLVITRIFDAPRKLVFEAFTDPKHLMSWWGPHGCTVISCEADPRVGGTWFISMRSQKTLLQFAKRYPTETGPSLSQPRRSSTDVAAQDNSWIVERQRGAYQEVVKPERLVFTYAFDDDTGRPIHQTIVTVTFVDEEGRTKLTLHQAMFESVSARDDHVRGWTEALEHLMEYLLRTK
jgi:uncharacterized protein YndB with AHSA1/START domain